MYLPTVPVAWRLAQSAGLSSDVCDCVWVCSEQQQELRRLLLVEQ